jgi:hypothetical protein
MIKSDRARRSVALELAYILWGERRRFGPRPEPRSGVWEGLEIFLMLRWRSSALQMPYRYYDRERGPCAAENLEEVPGDFRGRVGSTSPATVTMEYRSPRGPCTA